MNMFKLVGLTVAAAAGVGALLWLLLGGPGLFWFLGTWPLLVFVAGAGAFLAQPERR